MNITTSLIFMAIINWKLALIVSRRSRSCYSSPSSSARGSWSNVSRHELQDHGAFNENFQGVCVVKGLLREDENTKEFQVLTTKMYKASYRAAWLSALFLPTVQIVAAVAMGSSSVMAVRRSRWA